MSDGYFIEITAAERDEFDAILERWGNPDNYETPAERLMVTGLYPVLLQLKSVTTVPVEVSSPPALDWNDVEEITDSELIIENRPYSPHDGLSYGSYETIIDNTPQSVLDDHNNLQFNENYLESGGFSPSGFIEPGGNMIEMNQFVEPKLLMFTTPGGEPQAANAPAPDPPEPAPGGPITPEPEVPLDPLDPLSGGLDPNDPGLPSGGYP